MKCRHCPGELRVLVFCRDKWIKYPDETQICRKCGKKILLKHPKLSHFIVTVVVLVLIIVILTCGQLWADRVIPRRDIIVVAAIAALVLGLFWKKGAQLQQWK